MRSKRGFFLGIGLVVMLLFSANAFAINVTGESNATNLVNNILGPGVTLVGTPTLTGVPNQQGTFTSGVAEVGFDSGIVLTSGNATQIPGANVQSAETLGVGNPNDNLSVNLGTPGYAPLNTLAGNPTYNANVLAFSFQFTGGLGGDLYFNYVFASEEYIDYVGSVFNDVFGFFVDGVNIATIGGQPITVNNINPTVNSGSYINNIANTNGYPVANLDIKFDGLTTVLQAQALGLGAGTHTMVLAVADTSDEILDAGVFIQQGTFSSEPTPPNGVPEPTTMLLLGFGLIGLWGFRRKFKK